MILERFIHPISLDLRISELTTNNVLLFVKTYRKQYLQYNVKLIISMEFIAWHYKTEILLRPFTS